MTPDATPEELAALEELAEASAELSSPEAIVEQVELQSSAMARSATAHEDMARSLHLIALAVASNFRTDGPGTWKNHTAALNAENDRWAELEE